MFKKIVLSIVVCFLTACASGPKYEPGRSSNDIHAHIDTINLKQVYMADYSVGEILMHSDYDFSGGEPKPEADPSQNDQEVIAMAKAAILNQLTNYGYKVVEGDSSHADVGMKFFIFYQPERLWLTGRSTSVIGRVYDSADNPLFAVQVTKSNNLGLIGAMAGPSRDEAVAGVTRDTVVKVVDEMRKGTSEPAVAVETTTTKTTVTNKPPMMAPAPASAGSTMTTETTTTESKTVISTSPNTGSSNVP